MNAKTQILFVDDDQLVLSCFERLLGRHFAVETALGPAQAMDAMERGPFAVVISDMRMPGMNGVELLQKVREVSPETVGILLTGSPELDHYRIRGREELIFRLVSKPCPISDLVSVIETALEQYRLNGGVGGQ